MLPDGPDASVPLASRLRARRPDRPAGRARPRPRSAAWRKRPRRSRTREGAGQAPCRRDRRGRTRSARRPARRFERRRPSRALLPSEPRADGLSRLPLAGGRRGAPIDRDRMGLRGRHRGARTGAAHRVGASEPRPTGRAPGAPSRGRLNSPSGRSNDPTPPRHASASHDPVRRCPVRGLPAFHATGPRDRLPGGSVVHGATVRAAPRPGARSST